MAREMFGDVVKPSIIGREQAVVYAPAIDPGARGGHRCVDCDSAPGGRHSADAAIDDGVRRGSAAASAAPAASAAAAGCGAEAGDGRESAGRACAGAPAKSNLRPGSTLARAGGHRRGRHRRRRRRYCRRRAGGAPPPPPPPPAPVRVGGAIQPPKKIKDRTRHIRRSRSRRACRAS